MITLFSFGENFGLDDPSPFVLKICTYMKMANIEYKTVSNFKSFKNAPKGKLPYINDNGNIVADSFFILDYLENKFHPELDTHLTKEQVAISNLIIKSLDENFYWCIIYSRWIRDETWPTIKQAFFSQMPFPVNHIAPIIARKGVKSAFIQHGMGKHNEDEIMQIARDTLESLSALLSDKPYFFGDKPSKLDAVVYAFIAQVTIVQLDNPLRDIARSFENLVKYCERIHSQYYS